MTITHARSHQTTFGAIVTIERGRARYECALDNRVRRGVTIGPIRNTGWERDPELRATLIDLLAWSLRRYFLSSDASARSAYAEVIRVVRATPSITSAPARPRVSTRSRRAKWPSTRSVTTALRQHSKSSMNVAIEGETARPQS